MKNLEYEPFYKDLSLNKALEGGYFIPKNKIDWLIHINLPCTPINFLENDSDIENPAILIATGALCPMHEGHINMMTTAKTIIEERGYKVIGGYLSPGHDEYIKEKTGNDWMSISDRIYWANEIIKDNKWLAIDPWEGIFAPGSVNFTSVVYRLQQYIKKFYKSQKNIKIFFVCGGDNARFLIPFKNTEIGTIIIQRPKYDEIYKKYKKEECNNVIFCEGNFDIASTEIRKTSKYKEFKNNKIKQAYVRITDDVENPIVDELRKWFSIVWPQKLNEQKINYNTNNNITKTIINLDNETNYGLKLNISRLYDLFGQKKMGYTNRPKSSSLKEQIKLLSKKNFNECYLFDDDIYTGGTMDFVEELLKESNIKVLGRLSFLSGNLKDKEVLDAKDFLFLFGGLVSKIDDELIRIPYIYPFVDHSIRASINNPLQFSINMWKINMDYWKDKETTINSSPDYNFLLRLNHSKNDTIFDVCKYYYDFLISLI